MGANAREVSQVDDIVLATSRTHNMSGRRSIASLPDIIVNVLPVLPPLLSVLQRFRVRYTGEFHKTHVRPTVVS